MADISTSNPTAFVENAVNPPAEKAETPLENKEQLETTEEAEGSEASAAEGEAVQDLSKKEQKELAKELKKKFKLKIDGKEFEEEVDFNNEEEMVKRLQLGKAAQKRMQEATELRKAAEQFIDMLKTNPRKVLTDPNIAVDLKKLAQEIINEEIENANKSPEQLEKEKLQKELEDIKSKYEKEDKERKDRDFKRLQAEQEEKIQGDIESALKTSELPKTPYTVRKMAEMMMLALQNDIDLSPKDLVPLLRKQMSVDIKDLFSASSDDVLEELIGKDNISRIRKRNIAKVQKQVVETANSVKSSGDGDKKPAAKEEKKMTIKEFLKV